VWGVFGRKSKGVFLRGGLGGAEGRLFFHGGELGGGVEIFLGGLVGAYFKKVLVRVWVVCGGMVGVIGGGVCLWASWGGFLGYGASGFPVFLVVMTLDPTGVCGL